MVSKILTCPMPTNINPLSPNGFQFSITKLPGLSYFCQEVNIPDITIGSPEQATPFSDSPIPGDKLEYGSLNVQFLIDEDMSNYVAIHEWLTALGFPKDNAQYRYWMEQNNTSVDKISELKKNYSDATLGILGNNNNIVKTIRFIDLFPINLGSLTFMSTSQDVQYLIGNATFRFSYYEFV